MALFLQGIFGGVGGAVDFEGLGLHLAGLALAHRLDELAGDAERRTRGDGTQLVLGELGHVEDYLYVLDCRAVVESHKAHMLVAAAGAHPAFNADLLADEGGVEDIADFSSFHLNRLFLFLTAKLAKNQHNDKKTPRNMLFCRCGTRFDCLSVLYLTRRRRDTAAPLSVTPRTMYRPGAAGALSETPLPSAPADITAWPEML